MPQAVTDRDHDNWWLADKIPGSLGKFNYYTTQVGPYTGASTSTTEMDSIVLLDAFAAKTTENSAYSSTKTTYDGLKDTYNTAIDTEKARQADILKLAFEAYAVVPERPCPPYQPSAYSGPKIDWWVASNAIASINDTTIAAGYGTLANMADTAKPSLNAGFVQATPDSTDSTTSTITWSGHTFGLQGQGIATMPADGIAFSIVTPVATALHGCMVSIFPYDGTWTGLTSA